MAIAIDVEAQDARQLIIAPTCIHFYPSGCEIGLLRNRASILLQYSTYLTA
jgi:hypothetical protein